MKKSLPEGEDGITSNTKEKQGEIFLQNRRHNVGQNSIRVCIITK
jgi:hypothetical protein